MVNQLVDEGAAPGQITRSMPYYEIAHMYALCERAIIYDYCISDGGYALGEYTRKTMPLLFGGGACKAGSQIKSRRKMLLRYFLSAFVRDSRVQIRIALSTFKIKEPGTGKNAA